MKELPIFELDLKFQFGELKRLQIFFFFFFFNGAARATVSDKDVKCKQSETV